MQYIKLSTDIGIIKVTKAKNKITSLKLPKRPRLIKSNYDYKYEDILHMPPDLNVGTRFQKKIWRYIKNIPYGQTVSYKTITKDLKLGCAYRAVGQACKKNPIAVIIPCHRVIAKGGGIGGYSMGPHWKTFLINLEKSRI